MNLWIVLLRSTELKWLILCASVHVFLPDVARKLAHALLPTIAGNRPTLMGFTVAPILGSIYLAKRVLRPEVSTTLRAKLYKWDAYVLLKDHIIINVVVCIMGSAASTTGILFAESMPLRAMLFSIVTGSGLSIIGLVCLALAHIELDEILDAHG